MIFGIFIPLSALTVISYNNFMDESRYNKFIEESRNISEKDIENEQSESEKYNKNLEKDETSIEDPFQEKENKKETEISENDPDGIFAYLLIPKLDIKKPIYLNATNKHLADGVAQVEGTALPIGGENTRSVIAGHRGGYHDKMFLNIHDINPGDDLFIDYNEHILHYKMTDFEIVEPTEWNKLAPVPGKDMVTLLTCEPLAPPRPKRRLVNFERVIEVENEKKPENKIEKIEKIEEIKVDKKTKIINVAIYVLVIAGWIVIIKYVALLIKEII